MSTQPLQFRYRRISPLLSLDRDANGWCLIVALGAWHSQILHISKGAKRLPAALVNDITLSDVAAKPTAWI
jgi:hypothetical protein